ncbi:hypothetical protein [Leptobacterium sp. I13]|uniref:hypothetical protein n=1 Tax=Leptobacterium meishanense TaxID=3128904 RepID=UPI0030EBA6E1
MHIKGKSKSENIIIDSIGYQQEHIDIKSLYETLNSFHEQLHRIGYLESALISLKKENDTLYIANWVLNKKIISASITYDEEKIPRTALINILPTNSKINKNSFKIDFKQTANVLEKITTFFEKKGDPFIEANLENLKVRNDTLMAKLIISTTKNRTLDKIIVKGYKKFPKAFLKNNQILKKGKVFYKDDFIKNTLTINSLPFIEEIKPPEVLFEKDSTTVFLYLKKRSANSFDGFLGFGTDQSNSNINLNGYIDLKLLNNLNKGEEFVLNWKNNGNKQTTFKTALTIPYIFNTPIGLNTELNILRQDSIFSNTSTVFNLEYALNTNSLMRIGIENLNTNSTSEVITDNILKDLSSIFYTIGFQKKVNSSNNSLLKEKFLIDIRFGHGYRKTDQQKTDQQKINTSISYRWDLDRRNKIYLKNTFQSLFSDDYFLSEKIRYGGINSIRGFNENTIEATLYNVINTEYQVFLSNDTYIHSIIDIGYTEDKLVGSKNNLYGFGFGFSTKTAGGILKFNYAVGKTNDSSIKLSESKIHVSFSSFF